jgi:hypothetical protein
MIFQEEFIQDDKCHVVNYIYDSCIILKMLEFESGKKILWVWPNCTHAHFKLDSIVAVSAVFLQASPSQN